MIIIDRKVDLWPCVAALHHRNGTPAWPKWLIANPGVVFHPGAALVSLAERRACRSSATDMRDFRELFRLAGSALSNNEAIDLASVTRFFPSSALAVPEARAVATTAIKSKQQTLMGQYPAGNEVTGMVERMDRPSVPLTDASEFIVVSLQTEA